MPYKHLKMAPMERVKFVKQDIPFERLEAVPYTTLCIEHATEKEIPDDRPVEERYSYHGQPEFILQIEENERTP